VVWSGTPSFWSPTALKSTYFFGVWHFLLEPKWNLRYGWSSTNNKIPANSWTKQQRKLKRVILLNTGWPLWSFPTFISLLCKQLVWNPTWSDFQLVDDVPFDDGDDNSTHDEYYHRQDDVGRWPSSLRKPSDENKHKKQNIHQKKLGTIVVVVVPSSTWCGSG